MVKSGGKVGKSWKKLEKVGKSGEKWGRWENVLFKNFGQNGRRRPFWITVSITVLAISDWTKWPPAAILDWTTMSVIEPRPRYLDE